MVDEAHNNLQGLNSRANEALDQYLAAGETVEVIITGTHDQAIVGTNHRALVYKEAGMRGASPGSAITPWEYTNLIGVRIDTGMLSGSVILQAPGQSGTSANDWTNSDQDPVDAPNAIAIGRPWDEARAGVSRLERLISSAHHGSTSAAASAAGTDSPADELQKLVDLNAAGVLSPQEFTELKSRLLGGGSHPIGGSGLASSDLRLGAVIGSDGSPLSASDGDVFSVVLESCGPKKIQVVKHVRDLTRLKLKDVADLVDRTPTTILSAVNKEVAENAKYLLETVGADVTISVDAR